MTSQIRGCFHTPCTIRAVKGCQCLRASSSRGQPDSCQLQGGVIHAESGGTVTLGSRGTASTVSFMDNKAGQVWKDVRFESFGFDLG